MVKTYENLNIIETLLQIGLDELLRAVKAADLTEMLQTEENITLFAPDDEAFGMIKEIFSENFLLPGNRENLAYTLKYHMISSSMPLDAVLRVDDIKTMNGKMVQVFQRDGLLLINNAEIIDSDIKTKNGIIHKINRVLIPG